MDRSTLCGFIIFGFKLGYGEDHSLKLMVQVFGIFSKNATRFFGSGTGKSRVNQGQYISQSSALYLYRRAAGEDWLGMLTKMKMKLCIFLKSVMTI